MAKMPSPMTISMVSEGFSMAEAAMGSVRTASEELRSADDGSRIELISRSNTVYRTRTASRRRKRALVFWPLTALRELTRGNGGANQGGNAFDQQNCERKVAFWRVLSTTGMATAVVGDG